MENTIEALEIFVTKEAGQEELRKIFSRLYHNYSHTIISNALADNDLMLIPDTAANELYYLHRLIQILDGNFHIVRIDESNSHVNIH